MACHVIIPARCPKGHDQSYKCTQGPALGQCKKCEGDAKAAEAKRQKDFERQKKQDEEEAEHLRQIKEFKDKLAEQQQLLRDTQIKEARKNEIRQKMKDLQDAAELVRNAASRPRSTTPSDSTPGPSVISATDKSTTTPLASSSSTPAQGTSDSSRQSKDSEKAARLVTSSKHQHGATTSNPSVSGQSNAEVDWQYQKAYEGASNQGIDAIMDMVGLEVVKKQILSIKARIDVSKGQNTDMSKERFNIVLLGNPGTGAFLLASLFFLHNADNAQERQR